VTQPSARTSRWRGVLFLLGAGGFALDACRFAADPNQHPEHDGAAALQALAASTGGIAGNAVYQVRKESGASAYDATSNTTYITYNGPGMDIYVRAYDNSASAWGPLTRAKSWTHYAGGVQWSYHNYSTMVLGPDGKLHIFQADHGRAMYEIVAPAAHSLAGTWTERLISSDRTAYPSVNVVGNSIYLIYVRDYSSTPDTYRRLRLIRTDWNGSSWSEWSAPRTIIDTRRMMGTTPGVGDFYDEVYQQSVSLFDHKLWISFHLAGGATSCPSNATGHNCGAKDLYLVGLDVTNPSAPGNLYSVGGTSLGASVTCSSLGRCPEFLDIGTGARVARFPANPQSLDWSLSHPVSFSMAGWDSGSGTYFIGYSLGGAGDDNSVKLARFSNGSWNHMTVDRGLGYSLRDISMSQANAIELAYLTGSPVKLKSRLVTYAGVWPAAAKVLYPDLAVPMLGSPTPDRVSFLQIVATQASSGKALKMFGTTFNYAARQTDYTGDWNGFGLYFR
jgi:hypothetical protein